ncbi:MAG: tRNA 4-thiouridine(8) synthase ThiI [Oscillospiraceae bacterium]|nr:tRNA 4-thiouridine(8) synthase ThiI [Oscillospiraceae bacterium]
MEEIILLKQGEIVLKGQNKRFFAQRLESNISRRLAPFGDFKVYTAQSTVYVEPQDASCDTAGAFAALRCVFGVISLSRAAACEKDADAMLETAKLYLKDDFARAKSFKVESKRADKRFPMTSIQLSQYVGGELSEAFPDVAVDVHNPELLVTLEVRDYKAYVHAAPVQGAGGMPVGSNGRAVSLLSGGIDSPVATYMIAKRGISIIPVHFFSFPYTSQQAKEKVLTLAKELTPYCGDLTVEVVPFTEIQQEMRKVCPEEYFTIIMRRFMMRIAEKIANYNGCKALVTGESLGQVASQTMEAMAATEACIGLPVLRPVVGMDKEEIVRLARKIGTFETSILPYEDCCTVFMPRHPKTRPRLAEVEAAETKLDIEGLVAKAIAGIERVRV